MNKKIKEELLNEKEDNEMNKKEEMKTEELLDTDTNEEYEDEDYCEYEGDEDCLENYYLDFTEDEVVALEEYLRDNKYAIELENGMLVTKTDNLLVKEYINTLNKFNITCNTAYDKERNVALSYCDFYDFKDAAIVFRLLAVRGYTKAINDAGVCYERMGDYELAYEYYSQSPLMLSVENILKLYNSKKIEFDRDDYVALCNKEIDKCDQAGYLYLAYMYEGDFGEGYKDLTKVFPTLIDGYYNCKKRERICFELGYILEAGKGHDEDQYFSHIMYTESLMYNNPVSYYNFAYQLEDGRGCTKNTDAAIIGYLISCGHDYHDAIENLANLLYELGKDDLADKVLDRLRQVEKGHVYYTDFDDVILDTYLKYNIESVHINENGIIDYYDDAPKAIKRAADVRNRIRNKKIEEESEEDNDNEYSELC